jgi:hypothetical protein
MKPKQRVKARLHYLLKANDLTPGVSEQQTHPPKPDDVGSKPNRKRKPGGGRKPLLTLAKEEQGKNFVREYRGKEVYRELRKLLGLRDKDISDNTLYKRIISKA